MNRNLFALAHLNRNLFALAHLRRALWWLGNAALFVAVLEVCIRVEDRIKWNAPLTGLYSPALLTTADSVAWFNRPGAAFEKWHINRHGFRGPDLPLEKAPGVTRVAVLGSSETFGLYERPEMEYPAQLGRMLDEAHPKGFEVFNAGVAGMSL